MVRDTFQDGRIRVHEEVVTSLDGKPINVLVHTAPVRGVEGEISSVIEMSANITKIRELQSQLTSIGLLISSISHGLKGLINGLDGGIYLVNNGLQKGNQERIEKGWEIVVRNVNRIRSMLGCEQAVSGNVIPAEAGIQKGNETGLRVKPGTTINPKGSLTRRTSLEVPRGR